MTARCAYRGGGSVQCCRQDGHAGPHLYRCSSPKCPGLPWIASNTPHPTSCLIEELQSESEREAAALLERGGFQP